MNRDAYYQFLLQSYFDNKLTAEQQHELLQWLEATNITPDELVQFRTYDQFLKEKAVFDRVDKDKAWRRISGTMERKEKKVVQMHWWYGAAAVVILVLSIGRLSQSEKRQKFADTIMPGQVAEVTIETADGEKIALTGSQSRKMVDLDGADLKIDADSASYTADGDSDSVSINTLSVPRGKEFRMTLADGTKLYVNAESAVSYPTLFKDSTRRISVLSGEVYLEVAHNQHKPFIVEVKGVNVAVLGTRFNISSYEESGQTTVTLVEGSIALETDKENTDSAPLVLHPGQQAQINPGDKRVAISEVDAELATAWVRGEFNFKKQSLESIMHTLGRWYDFETEYVDAELRTLLISGKIRRYNEIDPFIDAIERLENISIEREDHKLLIKKNTDR